MQFDLLVFLFAFIQNIRWWQLKWKIVFFPEWIVIHIFQWFAISRIDKGDSCQMEWHSLKMGGQHMPP